MNQMHRRTFLKGTLLASFAAPTGKLTAADKPLIASSSSPDGLVCTPPSVQIPAPTSMGVVWGVNARATGFVDVATKPDISDARRAYAGVGGLKTLDDAAIGVRLNDLKPDTQYYYRTGTIPIDFKGAYKIIPGEPVHGEVHSFRTPGLRSASSFAVINDTHETPKAVALLAARLKELKRAVTVWNGDLCNSFNDTEQMRRLLLNAGNGAGFATDTPLLFTPGNHDYRGLMARELPRFLLTREPTERSNVHSHLNRNYAFRQGDIAMIGLDTGEDKADWRQEWGQLAQFTPYREQQAKWLAEALEHPEIKRAPYIVAFCHIPLFDSNPKANPGDNALDWASWQRHCNELWSPLLERYGVQLVVTAHCHRYRYDAPDKNRSWAHIVNGAGCNEPPKGELTLLDAVVSEGSLKVTVHNLTDGATLGSFNFKPRKV